MPKPAEPTHTGAAAPVLPVRPQAAPPGSTFASRRQAAQPRKGPPPDYKAMDAEARRAYAGFISLARELVSGIDQPYLDFYEKAARAAVRCRAMLRSNPMLPAQARHASADNYLYAHSANTFLLSIALAETMRLPDGEFQLLGFCALAHDIGMTELMGLAGSDARLSDSEFGDLTRHSELGAAKLDRVMDIDYRFKERARTVILQIHERADASGYPSGSGGDEIDVLAQIIGIADSYEAMTHPRPWRPARHPYAAVKELIESEGRGFKSRVVKALVETLSIYPPDSLVQLSSGEIARVLKPNRNSLARPVAEILLDSSWQSVPPRVTDLVEFPLTSVEEPVEEEALAKHNPAFAAKRELSRWWTDW